MANLQLITAVCGRTLRAATPLLFPRRFTARAAATLASRLGRTHLDDASGKTHGVAALRPLREAPLQTPQTAATMSRTKRNRLHKYRRDPEGFGRLQLTQRDKEILALIHDYRHLQVDHIQKLIPGNDRKIAYRLQGLYHHGFVQRLIPPSRMRMEFGSPKVVYTLDTRGARLLEIERSGIEERGVAVAPIKWRKAQTRTEFFVEHQIEISTFRATVHLALKESVLLHLLEWRQGAELQASFRYRTAGSDQILRAGIKPDAYFAVQENGQRRNFFLEIDRGTEEHARLREKFQTYYNYLRSNVYRERYHDKNPDDLRVLVVTTPASTRTANEAVLRTRLDRMAESLTAIRGRFGLAQFWFSTFDAYSLAEPASILKPIWRIVRVRDGVRTSESRSLFNQGSTA